MSTLTGELLSQRIDSPSALEGYFAGFIKTRETVKVGLEAEFMGIFKSTGKALPYYGPTGIETVLKSMAGQFHYQFLMEAGHIIGLKRGNLLISLEPGGQVELSAPPVDNVFEIESQVQTFLFELKQVSAAFPDIGWISYGIQPFSGLEEIEWVPKERYKMMASHFANQGRLSHRMMKQTGTNQINFDYLSEENAMANLRTALGLTSIVSAMFANSPFSNGRLNGFLTERMEIWNHTDPARSGLIVGFTRPERTFRDYLNYLLDMPMIFIVRDGQWIRMQDRTFRSFVSGKNEGHQATLGDFELHLSTAFPEVRLKQYIEIRGADAQRPDMIPAVAAFWKGILYHSDAREAAWSLVSSLSEQDRMTLHAEMPVKGMNASAGGRAVRDIAKELVEISCSSLAKQIRFNQTQNECLFLNQIRETIIKPQKSPAEMLRDAWQTGLSQNPESLIQYLLL